MAPGENEFDTAAKDEKQRDSTRRLEYCSYNNFKQYENISFQS